MQWLAKENRAMLTAFLLILLFFALGFALQPENPSILPLNLPAAYGLSLPSRGK